MLMGAYCGLVGERRSKTAIETVSMAYVLIILLVIVLSNPGIEL